MGPTPRVSGPADDDAARLLARAAILVVSYGSPELLERNLARVARAVPEAGVVVVDNYSTEETRLRTRDLCAEHGWTLVEPEGNTGFGGGMNLAQARAAADGARLLLLLNPDAVLDRKTVLSLLARAEREPRSLVAPVLTDSEGRVVADRAVVCLADGSMRSPRSTRPIPPGGTHPWLSGACLALSTRLFEAVGGFDERYFLYWEDVDFSRRVVSSGGALVLAREAVAVHDEGGTQRDGDADAGPAKSDAYYYYNIRNRLLYAALHLDASARRRWAATAPVAARAIVLRGGRRQLLRSRSSLRAAWAGTRDGLRLLRRCARGELPGPDTPIP